MVTAATRLARLIDEYGADHRHPVNKRLHRICVPAIVVSLIGLLWSLPVPEALRTAGPLANWGLAALAAALVFYASLSAKLAAAMAVPALVAVASVVALGALPVPLWLSCGVLFIVAWIGQFIGHAYEGKRPSFFRDLRFLLIGPVWVLGSALKRLGLAS